jgi:peptidase inhibitor family I36
VIATDKPAMTNAGARGIVAIPLTSRGTTMIRATFAHLAGPAMLAALFVGVVAGTALAVDASWDASCNSGEICNWKNAPYQVPLAATSSNDSDYNVGSDVYPNTSEGINDSVSSVRNLKSTDTVWFTSNNYSGSGYCVPPGFQSDQLGSLNDRFSSHLIAASPAC